MPQRGRKDIEMGYTDHYNKKRTPQTQPTPGKNQVKNNAGGYVYEITPWNRLERFLILGSEGGSYYASEGTLTRDNAKNVVVCIKEDGIRAVDAIVEVSEKGRASKNTPALFALALAASEGNAETKKYALDNLSKVARIGTHLFQFAQFVNAFRGWGRGLRDAIGNWYLDMDAERLAYQVIKYPQRITEQGDALSKWSHRDLLRKSHVSAKGDHDKIFNYAVNGWDKIPSRTTKALKIVKGTEKVKRATSGKEVADLVSEFNLPHEVIPKEFSNDVTVMKALLENMPLTATMRNLGRMTSHGVLAPMSDEVNMVVERLTDESYIKKSRIHPINVLAALKTYSQGCGFKGNMTWRPDQKIVDALDSMLYKSFENVESTGKKILIALDVSGSMGAPCMGMEQITAMEAESVMAMATARVESNYHIIGFTSDGWSGSQNSRGGWMRSGVKPLNISPRQRLDQVMHTMRKEPMGGTDCSLPMLYAIENKLDVDTFIVYTDSETYAGKIKPDQALAEYRRKFNPNAKLIVCASSSSGFSIADPKDAGMLDCVGFSSATPSVISGFINDSF